MKCDFCGREVNSGTTECPYCHYQFKIDAKVLSPNERDTFDGVTIEEDGSSSSSASPRRAKEEQNREYQQGNRTYGQRQQNGFGGIRVHQFGCGSGILMTLLILGGILALFFFLLPTFLVFAAIGAVVVFVLRLFM